jgi:cobalt-zinc-cadmium efflux system outer membrane protein
MSGGRALRRAGTLTGVVLSAASLTACAGPSIHRDVSRVQDLSRVEHLTQLVELEVDPVAAEDAQRLLAGTLDADTAVRVALLNNRELRATLRELGVARGHLMQAGVLPNPVVELEILPERNSQLELRVEWDITSAVLAPRRARAAVPELSAARYRVAGAVVDLGYSVREAHFAAQASEERLLIAQRSLDAFAAARDTARSLHGAGNISTLDRSVQEAAYETARVTVAEMELERLERREALHRLLGLHGDATTWTLAGELPAAPETLALEGVTEARALSASLELLAQRANLEALARRTGLSRAEGWLPDVTVDVHAEQDGNTYEIGGGARVTLPVFDQRRGATAALRGAVRRAMERYHASAVDLRSALRDAARGPSRGRIPPSRG